MCDQSFCNKFKTQFSLSPAPLSITHNQIWFRKLKCTKLKIIAFTLTKRKVNHANIMDVYCLFSLIKVLMECTYVMLNPIKAAISSLLSQLTCQFACIHESILFQTSTLILFPSQIWAKNTVLTWSQSRFCDQVGQFRNTLWHFSFQENCFKQDQVSHLAKKL